MPLKDDILKHLDNDYTEPVRDPLWGNIMLSRGFKKILSSEVLQKLNRIKQLGPSYHVYPGATHTRLSHSIGVFHISKRIIHQLLMSENCPELSMEGVLAFLSASLLHDLGHFPYAHSLKELPLLDHEELTGNYIASEPLKSIIKNKIGIDPESVRAIVDKSVTANITDEILFFRNLLSGVLDPDKLDYLNRDAYYCGVPYGIQDIDFIINNIAPHEKTGISLYEAGIPAVENILFSKYLMYRAVYWHKTVRVATSMIKKALYSGMKEGEIRAEELYGLDDESLFQRYRNSSFKPFELITMVFERNLLKTAVEVPFDIENSAHHCLNFLNTRLTREKEISLRLKREFGIDIDPVFVIIDIPEQISFEVDLPIITGKNTVNFTASSSVFSKPVVKGFTDVLRKIRVFLPRETVHNLDNNHFLAEMINNNC